MTEAVMIKQQPDKDKNDYADAYIAMLLRDTIASGF